LGVRVKPDSHSMGHRIAKLFDQRVLAEKCILCFVRIFQALHLLHVAQARLSARVAMIRFHNLTGGRGLLGRTQILASTQELPGPCHAPLSGSRLVDTLVSLAAVLCRDSLFESVVE